MHNLDQMNEFCISHGSAVILFRCGGGQMKKSLVSNFFGIPLQLDLIRHFGITHATNPQNSKFSDNRWPPWLYIMWAMT